MESQTAVIRGVPGLRVAVGAVVLAGVLGALFFYKWSGAVRTIGLVRAERVWIQSTDSITTGGAARATAAYFARIWPALVFGLMIGAALGSLVTPDWIAALLGRGGMLRQQISGSLAGAPLMLCSCCVTPIFTSVYEAGVQLGPALGVMLGSPGLNPAALVLTFLLFPTFVSVGRLATTLAAVFLLPPILERLFRDSLLLRGPTGRQVGGPLQPFRWSDFAREYYFSLGRLTVMTVPLIVAGVLLSSLILPVSVRLSTGGTGIAVALVGAIAVLVALPTFFEIPLALVLVEIGQPGAGAAMLFAGPIINLPSLLILSRQTSPRLAAMLAAGIWALSVGLGLAVAAASW